MIQDRRSTPTNDSKDEFDQTTELITQNKQQTRTNKHKRNNMKPIMKNALLMGLTMLMTTADAKAAEVLKVPEDITPPFYARIGVGSSLFKNGDPAFHDNEWAVIPFYRDPNTIPADFNLLAFFDVSVRGVKKGFLLEGVQVQVAPGPPIQSYYKSNGVDPVPVWFVPWSELQEAIADGELTIGELSSLENLKIGYAGFFSEVLHAPEVAQVGKYTLNAQGYLEDGTAFRLHINASVLNPPQVFIDFQ